MSRTKRNIPKGKFYRVPKHKQKLIAGESPRHVRTERDDVDISAIYEMTKQQQRKHRGK